MFKDKLDGEPNNKNLLLELKNSIGITPEIKSNKEISNASANANANANGNISNTNTINNVDPIQNNILVKDINNLPQKHDHSEKQLKSIFKNATPLDLEKFEKRSISNGKVFELKKEFYLLINKDVTTNKENSLMDISNSKESKKTNFSNNILKYKDKKTEILELIKPEKPIIESKKNIKEQINTIVHQIEKNNFFKEKPENVSKNRNIPRITYDKYSTENGKNKNNILIQDNYNISSKNNLSFTGNKKEVSIYSMNTTFEKDKEKNIKCTANLNLNLNMNENKNNQYRLEEVRNLTHKLSFLNEKDAKKLDLRYSITF